MISALFAAVMGLSHVVVGPEWYESDSHLPISGLNLHFVAKPCPPTPLPFENVTVGRLAPYKESPLPLPNIANNLIPYQRHSTHYFAVWTQGCWVVLLGGSVGRIVKISGRSILKGIPIDIGDKLESWRCPSVAPDGLQFPKCFAVPLEGITTKFSEAHIGPQLAASGVPRNSVGLIGQPNGEQNGSRTDNGSNTGGPCPPRAIGRSVCGFPLGAQIGITAIIAALARFCFFTRALRPFDLLVIHRSDIAKAIGYGLLSLCLLAGGGLIGSS